MKEQKSTRTAYLCKTSIEEPIKQQKQQIKTIATSNKKRLQPHISYICIAGALYAYCLVVTG